MTETYTTGTGQTLHNIHGADACRRNDSWCVIHDPKPGPWSTWRTHWREDRRIMERICPHGVGHPAVENLGRDRTHGCDGCPCSIPTIEGEIV